MLTSSHLPLQSAIHQMYSQTEAKKARELLAAIVETCDEAIASADLQGTIQSWNVPCEALHSLSAAEAIGRNLADIVSPFFRKGLESILRAIRIGDRVKPFEYTVQREDGSRTDVSIHVSPVRSSRGDLLGSSAIFHDVTDRNRSEEILRESLDSLEHAQRIGVLGCYMLDVRTLEWTSSAVMDEIFGIGESFERTLMGWTSLIHPDDREMMSAYFVDEVLGKGLAFDKQYRIIRQTDRAERWIHGVGKLDFDLDGHALKMRGVIRDVTEAKHAVDQLRRSEERYYTIFQASIDAILLIRLDDGVVFDVNDAFLEMTGYEREDVIGRGSSGIGLWADCSDLLNLKGLLRMNVRCRDFKARLKRKNGEIFSGLLSVSETKIDGVSFALSVLRDNSDAEATEKSLSAATEALRLSEARYRTAFQTSLDAININRLDDGRYIDCNQAFLEVMGFDRKDVLGRTSIELKIWAAPLDRLRLLQNLRQNQTCQDFEARFRRKNGEIFWGRMSASKIEVDGVPCLLTISRDVDAEKRATDEIENLAFYDQLTQIPNRRMLQNNLRQSLNTSLKRNRIGAILLIDLDDFKTLNDSLGHRMGDLLLQEVAARLIACSKSVGRLGGDEFVVILDDLSETADGAMGLARAFAEKIRAAVGEPYHLAGRTCLTTCSIGITTFGDNDDCNETIIQRADIAMYHSKAAGRNMVCTFAPALQMAVNARASMEKDLRQAIGTKQLELYYQPQIDRNAVVGAEALLRWKRPGHSLLAPGAFIELAEETGLIFPLGDWIVQTAFAQVAAWASREETERISLAVNISARQFRQPDFVPKVLNAIDRTGANPKRIKLELTESVTVDNIEDVVARMMLLKSHGFGLSLDDFGTGYSSLSYLRKLPLDELKIDRSFVRDLLLDAGSGAIAQTIISLSQALRLSVIAEGVESEEQRDFLLSLGCHAFQGYLFGPPVPLESFEERLAAFPLCSVERNTRSSAEPLSFGAQTSFPWPNATS